MKNCFFLWLFLFPLTLTAQIWYVVDSEVGLKLRKNKGLSAAVILQLKDGERVQLIEKDTALIDNYVWYKIKSGNNIGFAASSFIKMETTAKGGYSETEKWVVNTSQLRLRSSKSISNDDNIIYRFEKGDLVTVLQKDNTLVAGQLWYQVRFQEKIGFVSSKYLTSINEASDLTEKVLVNKVVSPAVKRSEAVSNKNALNKKYWDDGRKIVGDLTETLENDMLGIGSTLNSAMVSAAFRNAAKKLNNLDASISIYPEIRADVNLKIDYLNEVAAAVDGSFSKATAGALKYVVCKVIDMAPNLIKKKGYMPDSDVLYLTDKQLETLGEKLTAVNQSESKTIEAVAKKYKLVLKKW